MPGGDGVRGHAAVDSGPRHAGRLLVLAAGSQRRHRRVSRPERCRSSSPRRASGPSWPASTSPFTAAVPQLFADVDRDKVLKQGIALGDVYQTMQAFLGGLYVNQFNRFGRQWRVFLQAEGAGADDARAASASSTSATTTATMVPLSTLADDASRRSARSTRTASTSIAPRRSPARRRPATARGRRSTRSRRSRETTLPRGYQLRLVGPVVPGTEGGRQRRRACSRCRSSFVFLILAALYESWSLPFSVLLSVPIAVVRRVCRAAAAPLRLRRLRADRRHHADRPGGEERHPDRRVRQGAAARRARTSSTRRSKARSSGCGRS